MGYVSKSWKYFPVLALGLSFASCCNKPHYTQTNLVADQPGVAPVTDPNLVNPWGLTRSPTTTAKPGSPWWVSDNNSGFSTIYTGTGAIIPINGTGTVTIPPPKVSRRQFAHPPALFQRQPNGLSDRSRRGGGGFHLRDRGSDHLCLAGGAAATLEVNNSKAGSPRGAVYKGATSVS